MAEIHLDSVSFQYPGASEPTIRELSLSVRNGHAHALLGASGAGKTTLLNLLSGLSAPTSGSIHFDERDVSNVDARGRNVALVFQFPVLYESKTVLENLMFPLLNRGWSRADATARGNLIAEELEISDTLNLWPSELSLFQKQLTAIGKSLVRTDVDLVLLDEPLTAVEPAMKWRLRQTLSRLQADHDLTMIYVTHDQTEALTFADRVSVLADGRIVQTGTPEEIYNQPINTFIGDFIGSPGMRFASVELGNGSTDLPDLEFQHQLTGAGPATVGLRAEWLQLTHRDSAAWKVVSANLLGTSLGVPKSLLTLKHEGIELLAEASGDWNVGDSAAITAAKAVVLDSGGQRDAE